MMPVCQVYRDHKRQWRWRLRGRNGRILCASSEGFTRVKGALTNLRLTCMALSVAGAVVEAAR